MTKQQQDWPYLKRYEAENVSTPPPTKEENRVVFLGDSITEFWKNLMPEFFDGKPYLNRGISGQTTPQMLVRFRADVIALQPRVVVILAGANDIAGNTGPTTIEMITNNLFSMIELAQVHHIKVILCSVLPANRFPWKQGENPSQKIIALNKILKEYAALNKIQYLDYYSVMVDEKDGMISTYADDGVHPNRLGYEVMADLFYRKVC
ncbi:SGNH/GDSL hydrolase family protein [Flavobacterium sp. NG2]|uniref:SGNH/GDSL hydrolase family protein n=1 Tax=Flavobacterium sp. NG2 TaxID=3097547 RepID=UPI002A838830|nr:SGNH/GDSL hydrolase family protein [Flavobacterium sp. NG2]WPR70276.1 SGNH/GDSL hydrolase family protein [Flavobacterium sp. NG2]